MSPEQAKIALLEDALIQSYHTISFMHHCLTDCKNPPANGAYVYTYPEQTIEQLTKIQNLVKIPKGCIHGRRNADCPNCVDSDRLAILEQRN